MFQNLDFSKQLIVLGLLVLLGCKEDSGLAGEIAKVEVDFTVERFDINLKNADSKDLPQLKAAYPFLFAKHIPDSIWIQRLRDTLQNQLLEEVGTKFQDFKPIKEDIKRLFQHLKFYDKTFRLPKVVTLTNDVDYRNKCIVTDSLLLIALDNFLGSEHEFYQGLPMYISARMEPKDILSEIAGQYAKKYVPGSKKNNFLNEMIYQGKLLYFKDVMTPFMADYLKLGYTEEELNWAEANESAIWSYFVERELLYSTDRKLSNRFIADAPFSKFYLDIDNESPGRLGSYIGWQIVRAYANRSNDEVFKVLNQSPKTIFLESKFKPRK